MTRLRFGQWAWVLFGVTTVMTLGFLLSTQSIKLAAVPGAKIARSELRSLSQTLFPMVIQDPMGREIILHQPPQRIFSTVLAADEMLSRLIDSSRVVSISSLADTPGLSNVANDYPPSVYRNRGEVEEALAHRPDLVIIASYNKASNVRTLLNTDIPVLRLAGFNNQEDINTNLQMLAKVLDAQKEAKHWIEDFNQRIKHLQRCVGSAPKPRVLFYSFSGYSAGPGSLMDETITLAGGHNVIRDTGLGAHPKISNELAIGLQPEVIVLSQWSTKREQPPGQWLLDHSAWQQVPAIAKRRIASFNEASLSSASPFRIQGIEGLAQTLHPHCFNTPQEAALKP